MRRIAFVIGFMALMMGGLTIFSAPAQAAVAEDYRGWMYVDNGQETVSAWRHNGDGWITSRITSSAEWMWAHPIPAYRGYHYAYSPALQAWYFVANVHMHAYVAPTPEPQAEADPPALPNNVNVQSVFQSARGTQTRDAVNSYLRQGINAGANRQIGVYLSIYTVGGAMAGSIMDVLENNALDVHVATESGNTGTAFGRLRALASQFVECDDSCYGGTRAGARINHNKFMVINDINAGAGRVPAVMLSSANWNNGQLSSERQASVFLSGYGAEGLRVAMRDYWNKLAAYRTRGWSAADIEPYTNANGSLKLYLFPRPAGTSDPIVDAINDIDCIDSRRTVRIAQSRLYNDSTPRGIVTALRNMDRDCNVNILLKPTYVSAEVKALNALPHIDIRCIGDLHSKYMAIHARSRSLGGPAYTTFTGSHNWNGNSLRNTDEAMVRIRDRDVWDDHRANFSSMWQGGQASFAHCP